MQADCFTQRITFCHLKAAAYDSRPVVDIACCAFYCQKFMSGIVCICPRIICFQFCGLNKCEQFIPLRHQLRRFLCLGLEGCAKGGVISAQGFNFFSYRIKEWGVNTTLCFHPYC